jgi:hypothetical protein
MSAKPSSAACTRATIRRARTRRTRAYLAREMFEPACKDWLIFILSWETLEFRRCVAWPLGNTPLFGHSGIVAPKSR